MSSPTNQHPVFLQAGCPSCRPTNSVKTLKRKLCKCKRIKCHPSFRVYSVIGYDIVKLYTVWLPLNYAAWNPKLFWNALISLLCHRPGGIKRWCCLTSVCLTSVAYIQSAAGVWPAGWRVLADWAVLGRPRSSLPLRTSIAGLGGGILWRPPAYSLSLL